MHIDIKPLGRILRVGHRFDGSRRSHRVRAGWEYVHVAIDDYSRAAYVEVLPDQTGATTAAFLRRTVRWFARRGVVLQRVLTDNGGPYLSRRFYQCAARAGVRLTRTRHPGLGLCGAVCQLLAPYAGIATVAALLQSRAAAYGPRLSTTLRPLSEARAVINLVRIHS